MEENIESLNSAPKEIGKRKEILEKHKEIFRDYFEGNMMTTTMVWGLEVPELWLPAIDQLCDCIESLRLIRNGEVKFIADQVKSKFNSLRFYYHLEYASSPQETRYTMVDVKYTSEKESFEFETEQVRDKENLPKYGIKKKEILAFGVTSREQAKRLGEWFLNQDHVKMEVNEQRIDRFRQYIDGMIGLTEHIIEELEK